MESLYVKMRAGNNADTVGSAKALDLVAGQKAIVSHGGVRAKCGDRVRKGLTIWNKFEPVPNSAGRRGRSCPAAGLIFVLSRSRKIIIAPGDVRNCRILPRRPSTGVFS